MNPITADTHEKRTPAGQANEQAVQVGHVVSHTHWDREWRYPLWQTRADLVHLMDQIIDVLERGIYPAFLCDGQSVLIEDYLLIRPEMRGRIEQLVRDGKMQIGPWYTLPDTHPIELECFVRNLLRGRRVCEQFGKWMDIGYFSFGWGLPAQFPQLLKGFGIDVAVTSKYLDPRRSPRSEYIWRGPDGTEILSTRLGKNARAGFYFAAHLSIVHGREYSGNDYAWRPADGRIAFHRADPRRCREDYFLLEPPRSFSADMIDGKMLDTVWDLSSETRVATERPVMDGSDSSAPQPLLPDMLAIFNRLDPSRQMVHSSLPAYIDAMQRGLNPAELQIVSGELRDGPATSCSANALATRLYLKLLNHRATMQLVHQAEPLAVVATMLGADYPRRMLDLAWRYLLLSHCHDSINGVTQDKTANDVEYRLNQALEIGTVVQDQAMATLLRRIDLGHAPAGAAVVVAVNPLPSARGGVTEACIDFPWDEEVDRFHLVDATGKEYPVQLINKERWVYPVVELHQRPMPYEAERHHIAFDTGDVPALGTAVFHAVVDARQNRKTVCWPQTYGVPRSLRTGTARIENELVAISANGNGTFDLTDKLRGTTYAGLGVIEDSGDIGDYWMRRTPQPDELHLSLATPARVWASVEGPLLATLCIEHTLQLPIRAREDGRGRSSETRPLTVRLELTVRADSPRVDIKVTLDNQHAQHRLRLLFPTGLAGAQAIQAGGHGFVETRPLRIPSLEGEGLVFEDMQTQPFQQFVDMHDGAHGLAFLAQGLTEYQAIDDDTRTVALTLLRAVKNEVCTEGRSVGAFPDQDGGQCYGRHEYQLALLPHAGDWQSGGVAQEALAFNVPLALLQTSAHAGDLPAVASWLEVGPANVRMLALKQAEDRTTSIARFINVGDTATTLKVACRCAPTQAWRTNMNEDREAEVAIAADGSLALPIGPWQILTLELDFAQPVATNGKH